MKNKKLKTEFSTPLEIKKYMSILGAVIVDDNHFVLDGLKCEVDREYQGVYFTDGIPTEIRVLLDSNGLSDSYYGWVVFDLEGLILMHTVLRGEKIEEWYFNNLDHAKKIMLNRVLNEKKELNFHSEISNFDQSIVPFFNENFDSDKFLENCIFNTTGYYEKSGYDNCLKFTWRTKENPSIQYSITTFEGGYITSIMFEKMYDRFHQQLYHRVYKDDEEIKYFCPAFDSEIDVKKGTIKESINHGDKVSEIRDCTKYDILKIQAIARTFIDDKLSFEKVKTKKITK